MSDSNVRQKINFNFVSKVLGLTKDEIGFLFLRIIWTFDFIN